MLYTRAQLQTLDQQGHITAIQRYFNKIHNGEFRKLQPHECDYLGVRLRSIFKYDTDGITEILALDPYQVDFLWEAVFKYLILLYLDNLDFLRPVKDATHELSLGEIARDKSKFDVCLNNWLDKLNASKVDRLLHEVRLEYLRKKTIVDGLRDNRAFGWFAYQRKILEQQLSAFYIYFTVKYFFRDLKTDFVAFEHQGHRFVVNIYSYVHIISRHYIAKFNGLDTERSFNNSLPFINPFQLPLSIADLLNRYFRYAPDTYQLNEEYMIFDYNGEHYIIWWKEKPIIEINNQNGFEIRTLYKIESGIDQARIKNKFVVKKDDNLNFYY